MDNNNNEQNDSLGGNAAPCFLRYEYKMHQLRCKNPYLEEPVGDRLIMLTSGKSIFGMVLEETKTDLFLLHATLLVTDGDSVKGRPVVDTEVIRVPLSAVLTVAIPDVHHRLEYYRYLASLSSKNDRNTIDISKIDAILQFINKNTIDKKNSSANSKSLTMPPSKVKH